MFQPLSDRARKSMALANKEAKRLKHEYIAPEHILLGVIGEATGVGPCIFKKLGLDLSDVRASLEAIVTPGSEFEPLGKLPMTPSVRRVVENAILESRNLGSEYVGTEHILLGLMRDDQSVACEVLMRLGVTLQVVRDQAKAITGEPLRDPPQIPKKLQVVILPNKGLAQVVDAVGNVVIQSIQLELADEIVRRYNAS